MRTETKEQRETRKKIDAVRRILLDGPATVSYWGRETVVAPKEEHITDDALFVYKRGKSPRCIPWNQIDKIWCERTREGYQFSEPKKVRRGGLLLIRGGLADSIVKEGPKSTAPLKLHLGGRDESVRRSEVRRILTGPRPDGEGPRAGA